MDKSIRLYEEGVELARKEQWAAARPVLERSWAVWPHGKTAYWISKCAEAQDDQTTAFTYAAAAYALGGITDSISVQFARQAAMRYEERRGRDVLLETLRRNPTYGPAKQLAEDWGLEA